jgi:hypothetical protein
MRKKLNPELIEVLCIRLYQEKKRYTSALRCEQTQFSDLKKIQNQKKKLEVRLKSLYGIRKPPNKNGTASVSHLN